MKKRLNIEHKVCDYSCMWRGIEDIYQTKTKEEVPEFFFFTLSGQGEFTYLTQMKSELKFMVTWGDGRPKKIYGKVNDIIGFTYKHSEGSSFEYLKKQIIQEIDQGYPVVLGALDMYYLSFYPKMYHKMHVPNHYNMVIGYDDEQETFDILDCGMEEVQTLSYAMCEQMLSADVPGLSKKNGMCRIRFQETLPSLKEVAVRGFSRKCSSQLKPQVSFVGIPGMHKLAAEIDDWPKKLTKEDYDKVIRSFCQFTGTVPTLPERLYGCPKDMILHQACRDNYSRLMNELSKRCQIKEWKEAAGYFTESGKLLQEITDSMVEYLLGHKENPGEFKEIILRIAELEEKANQSILTGCEQSEIR